MPPHESFDGFWLFNLHRKNSLFFIKRPRAFIFGMELHPGEGYKFCISGHG